MASVLTMIGYLSLQCFLVSRDLREGRQPKENDQQRNEAGNSKICPLDILQSGVVVHSVGKENPRGEKRRDKGSHALNSLSQVQTYLAVFRRSADRKEGIGCGF
jgi:hypothetical protein